MSKLIVRVRGGLGNQLFCYAAARRLALVNNAELVIDHLTGFARDRIYRRRYMLDHFRISARKATPRERMEPLDRYQRGIAKFLSRRRPFERRKYIEQEGLDFDGRLLNVKIEGTVRLDGLWQSERYFKDVEDVIRDDLTIVPPRDEINEAMAKLIQSTNGVGVHVRWFHSPQKHSCAFEHNLSQEYYRRAIQYVMSRVELPHFFLFSDYPDAARTLLGLPEGITTCINHNQGEQYAYADLWLMTHCKHFIIANSTFSWWGAWLAASPLKIVVAPRVITNGVSAWGFRGLVPDCWMQL